MNITLSYLGDSGVSMDGTGALIHFAPNLRREPVYFEGGLTQPLLFRDALLNLHDLVVSDFDTRLTKEDWDRILDPVVTVARDGLFFEAFSQDESSYGRVTLRPDMLGAFEAWQGGTTNIDFTPALAGAIAKLQSSSRAGLHVEKSGFAVRIDAGRTREKKVQVPAAWLRGFLNVQAAMSAGRYTLELGRADLRNVLAFLQTHKERHGPRSLALRLTPGEPAVATFEPWNHAITLSQSVYRGDEPATVRLWGRRRLTLLNRLLPKIKKLTVYLGGSGYPSFWQADLGPATFTLGISGYTVRPFASSGASLAGPNEPVDAATLAAALRTVRAGTLVSAAELGRAINTAPGVAHTALALLCEQGKVMYDLEAAAYRWREVLDTPLDDLQTTFSSERLADGEKLARAGHVTVEGEAPSGLDTQFRATVRGTKGTYPVAATLDPDGRILDADCDCTWFRYNHLRGGPCKHVLALRAQVRPGGELVMA